MQGGAGKVRGPRPLRPPLPSPEPPGPGQPALTVDGQPHLLAGEAHSVGGRADIGPRIPGGRPSDDQGAILAHVVVGTTGREGIALLWHRDRGHGQSPPQGKVAARPSPRSAGPAPATLVVTSSAYLGPGDGGGGNSGGDTGERGWNPFIGDVVGGGGLDSGWHW